VKLPRSKRSFRAAAIVAAAAVAVGVSGCGQGAFDHRTNLHNVSESLIADGGEEYFDQGPITYQVQMSRALNPFDTEDVQYLAGIRGAQHLPPNQLWFGVFMWAKNQTNARHVTASKFQIETSDGTRYNAVPLNPSLNTYAWTPQVLAPDGVEPNADSTAAYGPTQGGLVLFRLNNSIYSNRPLTLLVYAPGSHNPSRVSLDL
jgi:hypothetical protein